MDMEELEPRKKKEFAIGGDLSTLSLDELAELIETLKGEIARIEKDISAKKSSLAAADSVFK